MKILLMIPPVILPRVPDISLLFYPPLGISYVGAVLEKNGYDVSLLDAYIEGWDKISKFDEKKNFRGLSYEEIENRIRELKPDIVGVSCTTTQRISAERVFSIVKKIDKNIITVLGGPHATVRSVDCVKNKDTDFAVIGEGEYTMLELVQRIENGKKKFEDIKGIAFKNNGEVVVNERRPLIQDLNALPFPARHLLPMEKYFEANNANDVFKRRWINIFTSRGCPQRCNFCTVHLTMGRGWRSRSPENVIEEIESLKKDYNIEEVMFGDDNMTLLKDRVMEICNLMIEKNLKLKWCTPNGVRADTLDEEMIKKMREAGCGFISIAPESGNQHVVNEIIGKNLNLNAVENAVKLAKKEGIDIFAFFVIGHVGETKENINDTINFARKLLSLGVHTCQFNIALPYYGTELYAKAKEKGYLTLEDGDDFEFALLNGDAIIKTPEFTPEELVEIRKGAIKMQERMKLSDPNRFLYYFTGFFRSLFTNPAFLMRFIRSKMKKVV